MKLPKTIDIMPAKLCITAYAMARVNTQHHEGSPFAGAGFRFESGRPLGIRESLRLLASSLRRGEAQLAMPKLATLPADVAEQMLATPGQRRAARFTPAHRMDAHQQRAIA